jgi:hypothetical protein
MFGYTIELGDEFQKLARRFEPIYVETPLDIEMGKRVNFKLKTRWGSRTEVIVLGRC